MFRIQVRGFGPEGVVKYRKNMRKATNAGVDAIAKKLSDLLRINISTYGLIWKGTLLRSIRVERVKRSGLSVNMVFYSRFLEKGHVIPPTGKKLPLLTGWARQKYQYGDPDAWVARVAERGHTVAPRPFISDSVNQLLPHITTLMSLKLKKVKAK